MTGQGGHAAGFSLPQQNIQRGGHRYWGKIWSTEF